jgi:hypothetical protein
MTRFDLGAIARRFVALPVPIAAHFRREFNSKTSHTEENPPPPAPPAPRWHEVQIPRQWAEDEFAFNRAISAYEKLIDLTASESSAPNAAARRPI